jgi:glutathione S-transferase
LRHLNVTIDAANYPAVARYAEAILSRPSFAPWVEREAAFLERTAA